MRCATGVELGLLQVPRHNVHGGQPAMVQQGIRSLQPREEIEAAERGGMEMEARIQAWQRHRGRRGGEKKVPGKQIAGPTVGRRRWKSRTWAWMRSWGPTATAMISRLFFNLALGRSSSSEIVCACSDQVFLVVSYYFLFLFLIYIFYS